jgi:RimJ/RimL family protein N-acetyltransferase
VYLDRAREEGLRRFTASILAENRKMLGLLEKLGGFGVGPATNGVVDVEGELGE